MRLRSDPDSKGRTELEMFGHGASSREVLSVLHRFPDVPTAEIIDYIALRIFNLVPLDHLDARLLNEARDIEYLPEWNRRSVSANVGGREHRENGDTIGEGTEVDQVCVGHDIIS